MYYSKSARGPFEQWAWVCLSLRTDFRDTTFLFYVLLCLCVWGYWIVGLWDCEFVGVWICAWWRCV